MMSLETLDRRHGAVYLFRVLRRQFLHNGLVLTSAVVFGDTVLRRTLAQAAAVAGVGPYGALQPANSDGIQLPVGFTSRLIAVSGQLVASTGHTWHAAPDGGACFPVPGGGWVYVSNSEVGSGGGGVGAVKFDAAANLVDAYSVLSGTSRNCAGGTTSAGAWLSCEENGSAGKVYECNPLTASQGVLRAALGSFNHEAAFVDPTTGFVYLTEDDPSGRFYRFVPTATGDLSSGQLYAANMSAGVLTWVATSAAAPDRQAATTAFSGGEGIWINAGTLYFTTKYDKKVWEVNLATQAISVLYDGNNTPGAALNAVDNVTVHVPSGDVYVAEDGGNMELCLIADINGIDEVAAFLRFVGHDASEVTGPAFSPDHTRLYVSSQRGTNGSTGRTYEVTGPFRTGITPPPPPSETLVAAGSSWHYLDNGTDQATAWRNYYFADSSWAQGAAPLGYGDPMATTLSYGPNSTAKYITSYFRRSFAATHGYATLTLNLRRDDGAVVYINGAEVARSNMPAGAVTSSTLASTAVAGADETTYLVVPISVSLYNGLNVIAVELHQSGGTSSDIGFDLSLVGTGNTGALPSPPPPAGTTTTLAVPTDSYVRDGGSASTNFGSANTLIVRNSSSTGQTRVSYLMVDTSAHGGVLGSATVRVSAKNASTGTTNLHVNAVSSTAWTETGINWNNKPALGAVVGTFTVTSKTAAWKSIDVTGYVNSERAAGRNVVAFAISAPTSSQQVTLSSSEANSLQPQIVLTS